MRTAILAGALIGASILSFASGAWTNHRVETAAQNTVDQPNTVQVSTPLMPEYQHCATRDWVDGLARRHHLIEVTRESTDEGWVQHWISYNDEHTIDMDLVERGDLLCLKSLREER